MLQLSEIVACFGAIEVLHRVSLSVESGSLVALLGGNGAGKTTAMRSIAGLIPIRGGRIELDGRPISGLPPHEVVGRGIVLVSQGRDLFSEMTVAENLELGALRLGAQHSKEEVLERQLTQFPRLRQRYRQRAGTLSGGERSMLAIARALMSRPTVVLMDEPTSGLAPMIVSELKHGLQALNARGQTILLVEQNVHMALAIASRVYVMRSGSIVLEAPASGVDEEELSRSYLA
jgi:branched-chain amino acid transport system ATP-binding protein